MYELPKIKKNAQQIKESLIRLAKSQSFGFLSLFVLALLLIIIGAGIVSGSFYPGIKDRWQKLTQLYQKLESIEKPEELSKEYIPQTSQEQATINVVKENSPAVVSIIISKNVPIVEQYFYNPFGDLGPLAPNVQIPQYRQNGTQKQEIGGGTGFFISSDGIILTNKHVVSEPDADFTVFTNDGKNIRRRYWLKIRFRT